MRNRSGPSLAGRPQSRSGFRDHKCDIAAQEAAAKCQRLTSPAATTDGACGRVRAWCRAGAASHRLPASRRTALSDRRHRSDTAASARREWRPRPDARNRVDRLPKGPRGMLRAFRESRPIVRPRSQPVLPVATVSPRGGSLAHSSLAMARNARHARRFENGRLSDRHPLRSSSRPSPDTVPTARIGRKTAYRQPVEVVVRAEILPSLTPGKALYASANRQGRSPGGTPEACFRRPRRLGRGPRVP